MLKDLDKPIQLDKEGRKQIANGYFQDYFIQGRSKINKAHYLISRPIDNFDVKLYVVVNAPQTIPTQKDLVDECKKEIAKEVTASMIKVAESIESADEIPEVFPDINYLYLLPSEFFKDKDFVEETRKEIFTELVEETQDFSPDKKQLFQPIYDNFMKNHYEEYVKEVNNPLAK